MGWHFGTPKLGGGIPSANNAQHPQVCSPHQLPSRAPPLPFFNRPTSFCFKPDVAEGQGKVICLTWWASLSPAGLHVELAGQCPGSRAFFIILLQWKHTVLQLAGKREKEPEGAGIIKRMQ